MVDGAGNAVRGFRRLGHRILLDLPVDLARIEARRRQVGVGRLQLFEDAAQHPLIPFGDLAELVVGQGEQLGVFSAEVEVAHGDVREPEPAGSEEPGVAGDDLPVLTPSHQGRAEAELADAVGDALDGVGGLPRFTL